MLQPSDPTRRGRGALGKSVMTTGDSAGLHSEAEGKDEWMDHLPGTGSAPFGFLQSIKSFRSFECSSWYLPSIPVSSLRVDNVEAYQDLTHQSPTINVYSSSQVVLSLLPVALLGMTMNADTHDLSNYPRLS